MWRSNKQVREWLQPTWLSISQVWSINNIYYFAFCLQRWAQAYTTAEYHAAVNTNNGAKALNKSTNTGFTQKEDNQFVRLCNLFLNEKY